MTTSKLISMISDDTGLAQIDVKRVITSLHKNIKNDVKSGGTIIFRGFGTYSSKTYPARKTTNPRTGNPCDIPSRRKPKFKASPRFMK